MLNILVTGGAGFIGSHLVDALIDGGHTVTVVDNLSTGNRAYVHKQAAFYELDIRHARELEDLFARSSFDIVFHEAAQTLVPYSMEHPKEDADLNIMGLLNVLELCRKYAVKKIIFSSSAAVYGDNDSVPIAEDTPLRPTSFYGLTKMTAEKYIQMYHDVFGLPYAILRYSNVYGERQGSHGEGGVVYVFSKALARGMAMTIFGDGEQTRDFVYVKDVVQANIAAMGGQIPSDIYNISTNIETTVNALKEILVYFSQLSAVVSYADARPGDIYRSALNNDKARQVLQWRPKTKLIEGLRATLDYFSEEESQ